MTATSLAKRVRKHARVLNGLRRVDDRVRVALMSKAKRDLVTTLVQCAREVIKRNPSFTPSQLEAVRRRASDISDLLRPGTTLTQKRNVLQRGGFLSALLTLIPSLVGGLIGGTRR